MKTIHVCFLWHMHQPYYTDPVEGSASMPWVRLHATKAYFDMAFLLERFPNVRATFNFTPSLLIQLRELSSGLVRDLFLEHARRPANELTPAERAFLVRHFFAANWATMVRPFPRYHELLVKRGTDIKGRDLDAIARQFTTQELLDLQVWHNLAWFGYGTLSRYPQLAPLRRKDRGFTEEEKQVVLALQLQAVEEIVPLYRKLAEAGQVEVTTSPFYHPILPLVIDTDITRRARPDLPLPSRFQAPADAQAQLRDAVALHTELFGSPPDGLWPSEGSVCPELIPLVRNAGIRWMATDEGVLARSVDSWNRSVDLYRAYHAGEAGQDVQMVFRDREISDAFGFVYSKAAPESAVENVLSRLGDIARHCPHERVLVPIILDGENPREYYHDGGERFLSGLYRELSKGKLGDVPLATESVSRALAAVPPEARLSRLHSGSWINADYKIWIGHPEDNRGWDLIRETRARLVEAGPGLSAEQAKGAWEELYAAEGSDWFWWYGDDFETDYKAEFDRLFRVHLRNTLTRAGLPVPEFLNQPLIALPEPLEARQPVSLLSPTIDGLVSDFFEWRGAGTIDPAPPLGAMWKSSRLFTYIGFGFSLDAFFLRLDPDSEALAGLNDLTAEVHLLTPGRRSLLRVPLTGPAPDTFPLLSAEGDAPLTETGRHSTIARRKILELALPLKDVHVQPGQELRMGLVIVQEGFELERYPRHQCLSLTVPDRDFDAKMWKV